MSLTPIIRLHTSTLARAIGPQSRQTLLRAASRPATSPSQRRGCSSTRATFKPATQTTTSPSANAFSQAPTASNTTSPSALPNDFAHVSADDKIARVTWASGIESRFHHIWLRDHCRCPVCYHPKTKQRLLNTFSLPADIRPLSLEATNEGLRVTWPPLSALAEEAQTGTNSSSSSGTSTSVSEVHFRGQPTPSEDLFESHESQPHHSLYPWKWLRTNSYAPPLDQSPLDSFAEQRDLTGLGKTLWGKTIENHPPTVAYEEIMAGDAGVWKWVEKIVSKTPTRTLPDDMSHTCATFQDQFGFSFVSGIPPTPEATEELVRRIAFIRETHYGGFWDFTSDLSHGDTAYTDIALGAHTDTTYFTDPAGLQMFHLLSHTESSSGVPASGGESLLVDGFLAAQVLRDVHPEAYETLSTTRISTHSAGDENTLVRPLLPGGYPILDHDPKTGQLVMVRYNNDDRSTLRVAEDRVEAFYDALRKWHEILTNKDGEYWCQLTPGNAVIFDNHRVLHGRAAFVGNRRLCGAYVNHDDYRSRLAVLRTQFVKNSAESPMASSSSRARSVWDEAI